MSQYCLDNSDCMIQEQNITCISLNDSHDEVSTEAFAEEIAPGAPDLSQDIEEGELDEDLEKETICEINFPTKTQFKEFGPLIIEILKDKLDEKHVENSIEIAKTDDQECVKLIVQQVKQNPIENIPMPPVLNVEQQSKAFEKEASPDFTGLSELFTIDTSPAPKIDSVKVPSYKRVIRDALLDDEAAACKKRKQEEEVFKVKRTNACFNCGETGHSIRECSKPHNAKRIKNAKKACFKVERYHVDVEQRFAHLKPGCISNKLREALGLRKGEIPFFFYRMRVMGYPPGWLEDAKVEHSGINLFNSDGTKMLHSDEDEGEIDPLNHKYNISKIYDFPGFNQDPGDKFYDDYKYHNVPPMAISQMKSEFIKTLGDNILKGYKRKKLKDFPNASTDDSITETTVLEATDMEIEDPEKTTLGEVQFTRPPPPTEQPPSLLPPPLPASPPLSRKSPQNLGEGKDGNVSQSPSLKELEKQKQQLLQELQSNISIVEIEDSLIDEIIELDEEDNCPEQDLNANKNSDNSSKTTVANENDTLNTKLTATVIKESFIGTPVLKFSLYDNLPNGEKFKVGVSDVINFENLPDSTGKYEQMKKVIKKVRSCINKLHNED